MIFSNIQRGFATRDGSLIAGFSHEALSDETVCMPSVKLPLSEAEF